MAVYYSLAFPKLLSWANPGRNNPTFHGYSDYIQVSRNGDEVIIHSPVFDPKLFAHVKGENLIFLRSVHGELRRLAGPINLQGVVVFARPQDNGVVDAVKPSSLFWKLFEPDDSTQWSTLRDARSYPR
jgi:hypothetical protein